MELELINALKKHMLMKGRDYHTVNELLHVLRNDSQFKDCNFNISIRRLDGGWTCIPTIDSFVNLLTLGIWFNDSELEFEVEILEGIKFDNITLYERKET